MLEVEILDTNMNEESIIQLRRGIDRAITFLGKIVIYTMQGDSLIERIQVPTKLTGKKVNIVTLATGNHRGSNWRTIDRRS